MDQERPPPSSPQAVRKKRLTLNGELALLLEKYYPHLRVQYVVSRDFDLSLLNQIREDVRRQIKEKRRQVGETV